MSDKKPLCEMTAVDSDNPSHLLRRLFMALRVQAGEALDPLGYTLPQFGILMMLKRKPGLSNAELARMTFVTPQAMGEVLSGLERSKLIRRKPHEKNARILLAELTAAGEKALAASKEVLDRLNDRMFSRLSPENKKQLGALLELCLIGLDKSVPDIKSRTRADASLER